jgi:hypothetical protein
LNADWDALPDLHDLIEAVEREIDVLAQAAALVEPKSEVAAPERRRKRRVTPRGRG